MANYPEIMLRPGKEVLMARKHPWIFSGAIAKEPANVQDGDIVTVTDKRGKALATGHYQRGSIRVRVLTFEDVLIDEQFWYDRLLNAFELRRTLMLTDSEATNSFRLVHGEGDGLPGLVIDHYNGHVVVQAHSAGMSLSADLIGEALKKLPWPAPLDTIYLSFADGTPGRYLLGESAHAVVIENDHQFFVDWETGQKTGFFLDQRDNRALLAKYSPGKTVLNTFCYSGGFSVYALKAGAIRVDSVDSSAKAIDWTNKNVELNNISVDKHQAHVSDVNKYLKESDDYDIVVLDPPAYAKHLSARHQAVQGYKRLNIAGIKKVKPGGLLFTFSCSQVVDRELFYNTIVAAAIETGRAFRVLHHLGQPADHPVNIFHPEGSYLKGLVLQVE